MVLLLEIFDQFLGDRKGGIVKENLIHLMTSVTNPWRR
jgi:hypothetical protein